MKALFSTLLLLLVLNGKAQKKIILGFDLNVGASAFILNTASPLYAAKANNWKNVNLEYKPKFAYGVNGVVEITIVRNELSFLVKPGFTAWGGISHATYKNKPNDPFFLDINTTYYSIELPAYLKYTFRRKEKYNMHVMAGMGIMSTLSGDFEPTTSYSNQQIIIRPNINFQSYYVSLAVGSDIPITKKLDLVTGITVNTDAMFDNGRFQDFGDYWGIAKMPINYYSATLNIGIRWK